MYGGKKMYEKLQVPQSYSFYDILTWKSCDKMQKTKQKNN